MVSTVKILTTKELQQSLDTLYQLDLRFFPYPWKNNDWQELPKKDRFQVFVLEQSSGIMGFTLFELFPLDGRCELLKIIIHPDQRGNGLGSQLLSSSLDQFESERFKSCLLEVSVENTGAIKTYENLGFKILKRNKSFYSDGLDAWTMELQFLV